MECMIEKEILRPMTRGVLYYNHGQSALLKMMVSIHSLRKVYDGPLTILAHGVGIEDSKKIAQIYGADFKEATLLEEAGRKFIYLNKCLYHKETPYDTTIAIDNDTIVLKRDFVELFDAAEEHEFAIARFADWKTSSKIVKTRIEAWANIYRELIHGALDYQFAINCGVIAFTQSSKLMNDWFDMAKEGRYISFIPDETCCQVILHKYPHKLVDQTFNTSCEYGKIDKNTKIIHYHGSSHCRFNKRFWYREFNDITNPLKDELKQYDKYFIPE